MSRELAVSGEPALSDAAVRRHLAQLRKAREYVRTAPEDEALKAKRDAETLRHWARINEASAEIAMEACRLQATAMRRLAQLGSPHIAGAGRMAAIWLGSLSDADFDALMDGMRYAKAPTTLYNDHRKQVERDGKLERGRKIVEGDGWPADYDSVCGAATYVLNAAMASGATTVNELTMNLADCLGYGDADMGDPVIREGVETVIREALRSENISGENHPDFVTWKDREAGWLRIPWVAATLDQLRWMAEFRQEQARELQEAADTLAVLVRDLDAVRAGHPRMSRLNDLWAELQAILTAEDEAA